MSSFIRKEEAARSNPGQLPSRETEELLVSGGPPARPRLSPLKES
jgi:hypothetical protein